MLECLRIGVQLRLWCIDTFKLCTAHLTTHTGPCCCCVLWVNALGVHQHVLHVRMLYGTLDQLKLGAMYNSSSWQHCTHGHILLMVPSRAAFACRSDIKFIYTHLTTTSPGDYCKYSKQACRP